MAAAISDEQKWEHSDSHDQEEEEEALSLCDLPVNFIKEENQSSGEQVHHQETETIQEDFNFGQWDNSISTRSEMCAADDIFFKGQILPLRLSVSSESGLNLNNCCKQDLSSNPSRCLSRSQSMDHGSVAGFTGFSSRSSSSRSQISLSSTNSSSANTRISKPMIQNHFHTHPSPKPQIRLRSNSLGNAGSNRNRKSSTVWDFFRLGLVRTPEIELQDLKIRTAVSRNSSSGSSNSNYSIKISSDHNSNQNQAKKMQKLRKQSGHLEKRSSGSLLSGCSCTVSAVKPVPLNKIIVKNSTRGKDSTNAKSQEMMESTIQQKKQQEVKLKKKMVEKQQEQHEGKQILSRHRTFEWIKELSAHASFPDHEQGPP